MVLIWGRPEREWRRKQPAVFARSLPWSIIQKPREHPVTPPCQATVCNGQLIAYKNEHKLRSTPQVNHASPTCHAQFLQETLEQSERIPSIQQAFPI